MQENICSAWNLLLHDIFPLAMHLWWIFNILYVSIPIYALGIFALLIPGIYEIN